MRIGCRLVNKQLLIIVSLIVVCVALVLGLRHCCTTIRNIMGWNILTPEEMVEVYYNYEEPLNAIAEGLRGFPNIYITRDKPGNRSDWWHYPFSTYVICNKEKRPLTQEQLKSIEALPIKQYLNDMSFYRINAVNGVYYFIRATSLADCIGLAYAPDCAQPHQYVTQWDHIQGNWYYFESK